MRKNLLTALLLPLIASLSFTVNAASGNATTVVEPAARVTQASQPATVLVDLNSADALTLQKELNGIGKAKAEAIVAYREAHGSFASVDELLEIKGIGNALLERNRDKLKVQ